jgi:hypothetical protein
MFFHAKKAVACFILFTVFAVPVFPIFAEESYIVGSVSGSSSLRWNNENWFTMEHPKVASFSIRDDGSAFGLTETGVSFIQFNVPNDVGIRIQRFEIEDHYHYIVEGEIAYTFEELSIHLARAYEKQSALASA